MGCGEGCLGAGGGGDGATATGFSLSAAALPPPADSLLPSGPACWARLRKAAAKAYCPPPELLTLSDRFATLLGGPAEKKKENRFSTHTQ